MMPLGDSFETVLAAAREGAEWAWADLLGDLAPPIIGYLRTRGAHDPEDLAGEVFLQLARDIHGFSGDEKGFRFWVFVIVHRRLIDERRRRGRPAPTVGLLESGADPPAGNTEDEALTRLGTTEVHRLLGSLTDDQRDVLALRLVAGLSLDETAQAVGPGGGDSPDPDGGGGPPDSVPPRTPGPPASPPITTP